MPTETWRNALLQNNKIQLNISKLPKDRIDGVNGVSSAPTAEAYLGMKPVITKRMRCKSQIVDVIQSGDFVYCTAVRDDDDVSMKLRIEGLFYWDERANQLEQYPNGDCRCFNIIATLLQSDNQLLDIGDSLLALVVGKKDSNLFITTTIRNLPNHLHHCIHLGKCFHSVKPNKDVISCWWTEESSQLPSYFNYLYKDPIFVNPSSSLVPIQSFGSNINENNSFLLNPNCSSSDDYVRLRAKQQLAFSTTKLLEGLKACRDDKDYLTSIKLHSQALQYDSTNVDAFVGRGAAFANAGDLQAGISDLKTAVSVQPNHPTAQKYLKAMLQKQQLLQSQPLPPPTVSKPSQTILPDSSNNYVFDSDVKKEKRSKKDKKSRKRRKD